MRLIPQEIREVSSANSATQASAPRGVFGIPASRWIMRPTTGVDATTYPPMMIHTICMVKGMSDQKPLPPSIATRRGCSPVATARRKTVTIPRKANTSGSGNQRSLQAASATPTRARPASERLTAKDMFSSLDHDSQRVREQHAAKGGGHSYSSLLPHHMLRGGVGGTPES